MGCLLGPSRRRESPECLGHLFDAPGMPSKHVLDCDSVRLVLVQGTKTPQGRKYEKHTHKLQNQSPTLGWTPKIPITENTKMAIFGPFLVYFFSIIFRILGAQPKVGEFVCVLVTQLHLARLAHAMHLSHWQMHHACGRLL